MDLPSLPSNLQILLAYCLTAQTAESPANPTILRIICESYPRVIPPNHTHPIRLEAIAIRFLKILFFKSGGKFTSGRPALLVYKPLTYSLRQEVSVGQTQKLCRVGRGAEDLYLMNVYKEVKTWKRSAFKDLFVQMPTFPPTGAQPASATAQASRTATAAEAPDLPGAGGLRGVERTERAKGEERKYGRGKTYIHTCTHACIHAYMHTCTHARTHT